MSSLRALVLLNIVESFYYYYDYSQCVMLNSKNKMQKVKMYSQRFLEFFLELHLSLRKNSMLRIFLFLE